MMNFLNNEKGQNIKIAFTGHTNIEKTFGKELKYFQGNGYDKEIFNEIYTNIEKILKEYKTPTIISGMARGVDEVVAIYAIRNNLPLIISVPNSVKWHKNRGPSRGIRAQAIYYNKILSYDKIEIFEIKKTYGDGKEEFMFANFARNQHMVDISDILFSYKVYNSSGTDDGIKRGKKQNKYKGNIPDLIKEL